jgi:hypothetical protein
MITTGNTARHHTSAIAGVTLAERPRKPFMAFSGNPSEHLMDAHVWLIERIDDRYLLQAVFIVDEVRPTPPGAEMDLTYQVLGKAGISGIDSEIGNKPWWTEFFNSIGHGGLGISQIKPKFVRELQTLTSQRLKDTSFLAT